MSVDLKATVSKVKVNNGDFQTTKDKDVATEIWKRYSLQSMFELCSFGLTSDTSQRTERDKNYVKILEVLVDHAPDSWIQTFIDGFNEEHVSTLCFSSVRTVSKIAEIPAFSEREHYVFDESDFQGVTDSACIAQKVLQILLKRVFKCEETVEDLDAWKCKVHVAVCLLGIVSQHMKQHLWTSEQSRSVSHKSLTLLKDSFHCATVNDLFLIESSHISTVDSNLQCSLGVKKSLIGKLLLQWRPSLQRQTWRQFPGIAAGFQWCLCHLRFPNLSEFIELLLPPSLLFVDDHVTENKELGTVCLIHILQNSTSEELKWYGRADVIYQAFKLQLYSTEEKLLKMTHEAMLIILKVIVKDKDALGATTKYDEVFAIILQAAIGENKLALRRIHTELLYAFIEAMGINVVKYLNKLLELFEDYLEISDVPEEQARINTLKALESLIKVAWPRIPSHFEVIIKVLVKLLHHLTSQHVNLSEAVEAELISYLIVCFELLKELDSERVAQCLQSLDGLLFSRKCSALLQQLREM